MALVGNVFHKILIDDDIHALTARTYADIAARDNDTAFHVTANLNKQVRIDSPLSFYILGEVSPSVVWLEFSSIGGVDTSVTLTENSMIVGAGTNFVKAANITVSANLSDLTFPAFGKINVSSINGSNLLLAGTGTAEFNAGGDMRFVLPVGSEVGIGSGTIATSGKLTLHGEVPSTDESLFALLDTGMATTNQVSMFLGKNKLTNDSARIGFEFFGVGLSTNKVLFGVEGTNEIISYTAGGTVTIPGAATSTSLSLDSTVGALRLNRLTTTQRDALTPLQGMTIFNTTTLEEETYTGTLWAPTTGVVGPASSTDNAIARFDGTNGDLIQDTSNVLINDAGNIGLNFTPSSIFKLSILALDSPNDRFAIDLIGAGTATKSPGVRFNEAVGSNSVILRSADSMSGNYDLLLPDFNGATFDNSIIQYLSTGAEAQGTFTASPTLEGLSLAPFGVAAGNTAELRLLELAANGSNYIGFKAPDLLAGNQIWTLPDADGSAGQHLETDGAGNLTWELGGGDVVGPASSTDNAVARFDLATGKLLQDSGVLIDDSNNVTGVVSLTLEPTTALGLQIDPFGVAAGNTGEMRLLELAANGTNYVAFKAPDALAVNRIWTLPEELGSTGEFLMISAAGGILGWSNNVNGAVALLANGLLASTGLRADVNNPDDVGLEIRNQGQLQLQEQFTNGTNYVGFKAVANLTGNTIWTLPAADGLVANAALVTDSLGILSWSPLAVGDVVGPGTATDNAVARFNTASGKLIQDTPLVTIDDLGKLQAVGLGVGGVPVVDVAAVLYPGADGSLYLQGLGGNAPLMRIYQPASVGTNFITLLVPSTLSASYTFELPVTPADGRGQLMVASVGSSILTSQFSPNPEIGGDLRLLEDVGNGNNYLGFTAPAAVTANVVWELPDGDGIAAQVLATDGSGNLDWVDKAATFSTPVLDNAVVTYNGTTGAIIQDCNVFVLDVVGGRLGINTPTIPHIAVGTARFAMDGTDASTADGPHIQYTTALDDFPLFQQLNFSHDNIAMTWDGYFDGVWKSSDIGSNFQIEKTGDIWEINSSFGIAQALTITWLNRFQIKEALGIVFPSEGLGARGPIVRQATSLTAFTDAEFNSLNRYQRGNSYAHPLNMSAQAFSSLTEATVRNDGIWQFSRDRSGAGWNWLAFGTDGLSRQPGRTFECLVDMSQFANPSPTPVDEGMFVGWCENSFTGSSFNAFDHGFFIGQTTTTTQRIDIYENGSFLVTAKANIVIDAVIRARVVMKATGATYWARVNDEPWEMLFDSLSNSVTTTPLHPGITVFDGEYVVSEMSVWDDDLEFSRNSFTQVEVWTPNDFPAPVSGVSTLAANTEYVICASFSMADRLEVPDSSISGLRGATRNETITWTGSSPNAFISSAAGSTAMTGEITIAVKITSTGTGSLLDVDGHGLLIQDGFYAGFDEIGTARNTAPCIVRFCRFLTSGGGFKFIDCQAINFLSMLFFNSPGATGAHITVIGQTTINVALDNFTRQTAEYAMWIDPFSTANAVIVGVNAFGGVGAGFFQKTGTAAITGESDPGGGLLTTVTTADTGTLANGDGVRITGTTNYNGGFIVSSVVLDTSFDIERTFAGNDGVNGDWDGNSRDEKSIGMLVDDCAGQKDSKQIGSGVIGANATATVIATQSTPVDLNLNANFVAAGNIERFTVTNSTTGEMRYDGDEPFDGEYRGLIATTSTGGGQRFNFSLLKNGSALSSPDNVDVPIEVGNNLSAVPILWPIELVQNDLLRMQVENADGTSNITIDTLKVDIS